MDIQKEREAFEHHLTDTGLVEFAGYGFEVDKAFNEVFGLTESIVESLKEVS